MEEPLDRPLTLAACPTLFGKLVLLASFRDPQTGIYREVGSVARSPSAATDRLREAHEYYFAKWVGLGIEEQMEDITRYFDSLAASPAGIVRRWTSSMIYQTFMPESATEEQKILFLLDIESLLQVLALKFADPSNPV